MKFTTGISTVLAPLFVLATASQAFAPHPGGDSDGKSKKVPSESIKIKKLKYNGSGCERGSIEKEVSRNKRSFTLSFSEYDAAIGPDSSKSDSRKSCHITLALSVPDGWMYSIESFTYRGFMDLNKGIEAEQKTSYSFEGQDGTGKFSSKKYGEYSGNYVHTDNVDSDDAIWSECGSSSELMINSSIKLKKSRKDFEENAEGSVFKDSDWNDGQYKQVWRIKWKRCN